ncbi:sucrose transporter [Amylocarpus encephaloides]|uniref:Sucrose transporter n=1 Tax=Amylocarpus encephaloides TaxID=45428 RepID=A0A9P7YPS3_9HELO|nr:sucrose transporter [Amylocarpus encephaloides]
MDRNSLDTARLLPESGRLSIDSIAPPQDDNETVKTTSIWSEADRQDPERPVRAKYLILLTCGTFGLQNVWSLLLANGTPYLLSLGFSRSTTALIWMAGPLTGTFIQPFIGAISDQSTSKWGKRKPFIVVGIIGAVVSMLSMAIMKLAATKIYLSFGREYVSAHGMGNIARTLVIFWVGVLNLSLQPIQVGLRALVVDGCPSQQQSQASAWAGRFTGLGGIATYILDDFLIRRYQDNSFEVLCIITSISLILTNIPCLLFTSERRASLHMDVDQTFRPKALGRRLLRTARRMPDNILNICNVQFASWLGWFPFLYYNTTYISALGEQNMRVEQNHPNSSGVQAYLLFAIVAFFCSVVLPLIKPSAITHSSAKTSSLLIDSTRYSFRPSLTHLWLLSQILFAVCMFSTIFINDTAGGIFMVASAGVSWSLTQWVPLAMMSGEIASMREAARSEEVGDGEDETGTLMSIFNVAISAPQILAGALCSGLFWVIGESDPVDTLGWALRMGGLAAVVSALLMLGLKR